MNKFVIIGGGVALLALGAFLFLGQKGDESKRAAEVLGEPAVTIVRTNSGYEPKEVTIKKGDIVLWKNESDDYHWPASDLHPTHAIYSEFDPLKPVAPGADWKFKFDKTGIWKYHDHIRANKVGTVTVVE
jgi:plastocyanin